MMNKKIKCILAGVTAGITATATFIAGRITGYNKGKKEAIKVSGKLEVIYNGKNDKEPELYCLLKDINDIKNDYIVMKVERSIVTNKRDVEKIVKKDFDA